VVPSVSRDILKHGPSVAALRAASARFVEEIATAVK
jgi:orotidine-5'-phosphate decarboxylase